MLTLIYQRVSVMATKARYIEAAKVNIHLKQKQDFELKNNTGDSNVVPTSSIVLTWPESELR